MTRPVLHLIYHEVRKEPSSYLYNLPLPAFGAHLDAICAPAPEDRASLVVTFDDGHRTQYEQAFPALSRHGLKAIFFVTAGFTGTADYMTWVQLRELSDAGHQLQAHGWHHRMLTHCTEKQLEEELRLPKETIEDRVGRPVDALSFPNGRYDQRVADACLRVGYRRAFTSEIWPPSWERDGLFLFARLGIMSRTPAAQLTQWMRTGGPSRAERVKRGLKLGLRRAIGDKHYHRLWRLVVKGDPDAEKIAEMSGAE